MRADMSKVIVERPRPGSSRHVARRHRRLDVRRIVVDEDADDIFPARIGHKRAAALMGPRKWLNENLAPLRRYLEAQTGRHWDDVWSEVCANISIDSTVQKHVRDHVQDIVAIRTSMHDGELHHVTRWGGLRPLVQSHWLRLYVDPETRVLRRIPLHLSRRAARERAQAEQKAEAATRMRVISASRQLHLLDDGNWWEITLANTADTLAVARPQGVIRPHEIEDVVERAGMSQVPREQRYGRWGVHAVAKRPLSHREIKARKLR